MENDTFDAAFGHYLAMSEPELRSELTRLDFLADCQTRALGRTEIGRKALLTVLDYELRQDNYED